MPADSKSGEALPPGSQTASLRHLLIHMAERARNLSGVSSIRSLVSLMKTPPSWSTPAPGRPYLLTLSQWESGFQYIHLGRGHKIQSMTPIRGNAVEKLAGACNGWKVAASGSESWLWLTKTIVLRYTHFLYPVNIQIPTETRQCWTPQACKHKRVEAQAGGQWGVPAECTMPCLLSPRNKGTVCPDLLKSLSKSCQRIKIISLSAGQST